MSKTFDEIENAWVRQLAKLVTKSKAWKESDPLFRQINDSASIKTSWPLWNQFQDNKRKQTRLKAELTRYMKRFGTVKGEGEKHLQTIVADIVNDLANVQEQFIYWQKEVEEWLSNT